MPMGVPRQYLMAIANRESSLHPWTINVAGDNEYGQSQEYTLRLINQIVLMGYKSIDVGCMQMNLRWHGSKFRTLEEMLNPDHNVYQASKFLVGLYKEYGNWPQAIGAYHSRLPSLGQAYYKSLSMEIHSNE
nr:transglycosylase SLT domain-containing protein [Kiloniella laminariae]